MCLAAAVYAEQLLPKGHGYPLWIPEPDTAEATVRIGDVGFVWEGSFCTLFNATLPATHPVNSNGVPVDFVPLSLDSKFVRTRDGYLSDAPIYSRTVRRLRAAAQAETNLTPVGVQAQLSFECDRNKGGLLVVNGGGAIQETLHPNKRFPEYMHTYHDTWCQFASDQGYDVAPEDIVMVRGTVKSSEWTVAAFVDESRHQSIEFNVQGVTVGSVGLSLTVAQSASMFVEHRSSRSPRTTIPTNDSSSPKDQCLFLCRYKMFYRKWLWKDRKIKAEGYRDDEPSSDSDSEDDTSTEGDSEGEIDGVVEDDCIYPRPRISDPLDTLLKYILENSECDVAIASDEDVKQLADLNVVATTIGYRFAEQLRAARPRVEVSADGAGHLVIRAQDTLDSIALDSKNSNITRPSEVPRSVTIIPKNPPPPCDLAGDNFAPNFMNSNPTHDCTGLEIAQSGSFFTPDDTWHGLSSSTCPTPTPPAPYSDHFWSRPFLPPFTPYPPLNGFDPDGCTPSMHMNSYGERLTDTLIDTELPGMPSIRVASRSKFPSAVQGHDRRTPHDSRTPLPRPRCRLKVITDESDYNASIDSRIGYGKNCRPTRRARFQNTDGSIPIAVDVTHSSLRGLNRSTNLKLLSLKDSSSDVRSDTCLERLNLRCMIWLYSRPMDQLYPAIFRGFVCSMSSEDINSILTRSYDREEALQQVALAIMKRFELPPQEFGETYEMCLRLIQIEHLDLTGLDRISLNVWPAEMYYCPGPLAVGHPGFQTTPRLPPSAI